MHCRTFAIAVAWLLVFASTAAHALTGGAPGPNSCYAKCGNVASPPTLNCYCDFACESVGDCCTDKNEYCAADPISAREGFPTAAAPICSLTGSVVPGAPQMYSNLCGTDLGFVFPHNDASKLEIMFGDSSSGTPCIDWGLFQSDDVQARLPSTRPAWLPTALTRAANPQGQFGANCHNDLLTIDGVPGTSTFYPIRLFAAPPPFGQPEEKILYVGTTPIGGFSDGNTAYGLFGVSTPDGNDYPTWLGYRDQGNDAISRTTYRLAKTLNVNFTNPTVARVTSFAPNDPSQASSNYDTPAPGTTGGAIFIWGRPRVGTPLWQSQGLFCSGTPADPNTNGVYLMRQSLPLRNVASAAYTLPSWSENQYFTGVDASGLARWGAASSAVPVFNQDFRYTEELDIKWIKEIRKWVMLYGGDESDGLTCPLTNDQPRHGAIHMRMADYPWGPWTRPTPVLWREEIPWYFHCDANSGTNPIGCDTAVYPGNYGDWRPDLTSYFESNCRTDYPGPVQPNGFCLSADQRGLMYAPNMLPTWTAGGAFDASSRYKSVTIYFVVSTWVPYEVNLSAMVLKVPSNIYDNGVKVRLRDSADRMVTSNSVSALVTQISGAGGGPTALNIASVSPQTGPMRIGDTVTIRSVKNNTFLARSGAGVAWVATATNDARWLIESTNAAAFPNGVPVVPESTPFRLTSFTTGNRLRSSSGLTLSSTLDAASTWKFSWSCHSGDTCGR